MAGSIIVEAPRIWCRRGIIAGKEVRLHCRGLIVSVLRLSQNAIEQFLFDIKKAKAKISHEPLEGRARSKIKSACANVDRSVAGSLHDIGIDICAPCMGEITHCFEIVLKSVSHSYQRDLDEFCLPVNHAFQILEIDPPIAGHHDTQIEPGTALKLAQMEKCAVEVESVSDDIGIGAHDSQPVDDEVLTCACA